MKKNIFSILICFILVVSILAGIPVHVSAEAATGTSPALFGTETAFLRSAAYLGYPDFARRVDFGKSIVIPGVKATNVNGTLGTAYAVQGIAFTDEYCVISAYDRNAALNSVLYLIDAESGRYITTVVLPTTAHLGGLAFDGENLWMTVGSSMACLKKSTIKTAANSGNDCYVVSSFASRVDTSGTCSFATYYNGKLWVGEFTDMDTNSYLYSYTISKKTGSSPSITAVKSSANGGYRIQLPDRTQGVTFTSDGKLIVSRSYRASTSATDYISQLRVYNMKGWSSVTSTGTIEKGNAEFVYTMPPMAEGIAVRGDNAYLLFESAAYPSCRYQLDRVCAFPVSYLTEEMAHEYTVKFNANGGTGTMADQTMTIGQSAVLNTNTFAREGYIFSGWAFSASGAAAYDDGAEVTDLTTTENSTVTLYAVWNLTSRSGSCGETANWTLIDGTLTVSGTGTMTTYSAANPAPWNEFAPYIRNIVVEDGVTSVGNYAFNACSAAKSLYLGKDVKNVAGYSFNNTSLESIEVSEYNVYFTDSGNCLIKISGKRLILGCADSVIPADESVTVIGSRAFAGCTGLNEITIPANITDIWVNAFAGCSNLTDVTYDGAVTGWNDIAICSGNNELKNAQLHFTVTAISGTCGAKAVWTLDENGLMVISGSGSMTIFSSPEDTPWHAHRSEITDVRIKDSVTTIGAYSFSDCSNLRSIYIGKGVTNIGTRALYGCTGIGNINVSPDNKYFFASGDCLVKISNKSIILGCATSVIPTDGSAEIIAGSAFLNLKNLTDITIPCTIKQIWQNAFTGCDNITHITYLGTEADWNKIAICSGNGVIKSADITYAVTDTVSGTCGDNLVWTLDENGVLNITGKGAMTAFPSTASAPWYGLASFIREINIGDGVTTIGSNAFTDCSSVTVLNIGKGVKAVGRAFFGLPSIRTITVSADNKYLKADGNCLIVKAAKRMILGGTSSVIPTDGSVTVISSNAFYKCIGLTEITIPASVYTIWENGFGGCNGLKKVNYLGTAAEWAEFALCGGNNPISNAKLNILG
ncbi:MAG: leucine-rich repeat protein [Clostridia bacterium]|nr:leucine-rich repeat protein [Clostridia bacterium]